MSRLAFAALVLCSSAAQAAFTFSNPENSNPSGAGTTSTDVTPVFSEVMIEWGGTPVTAAIDFSSSTPFTISLEQYAGSSSGTSAFTLDFGSTRLTTEETLSSGSTALAPVTDNGATFDRIGVADVGDLLLGGQILLPGNYTLGFFDSANPVSGTAVFGLTAVPELASLSTWAIAGLAGTVWMRRRQ